MDEWLLRGRAAAVGLPYVPSPEDLKAADEFWGDGGGSGEPPGGAGPGRRGPKAAAYNRKVTADEPAESSPAADAPEDADAPVLSGSGPLEAVIAAQVKRHRAEAGISAAELAARTGLSKAMISKIESARTSCSLTTVQRLAEGLNLPVTSLFQGADTEREATLTKAGEGSVTVRSGTRHGHEYRSLGTLKRRGNAIEPTLVTLTSASDVFPQFQHSGTEFIYMLQGRMVYGHGSYEYELAAGDSLVFEGEGPVRLLELPIQFLAVTAH
ncbi:helix-turn-helix domain-containing protein [Arthrobacter deserti]|uniref:Helix-turn-helix domain-containing protein n=1 Tax=Arthrobacter deserti TaxID=1742687 RepID=A0ABX1JLQ5_9MICC|nr:helix-turn-helix domain-containing protein [Arthrobacter deserti]